MIFRGSAVTTMNLATTDRPREFPIPATLNIVLVFIVFFSATALLVLASRVGPWWAIVGVGFVFSYLMLTNYALLHEATHDNLHPGRQINAMLGVVAGLLFPMPFSLIRTTHQNHHARNRTDSEMFDLYYPTDNIVRKYVQWYGILLGFFWPLVPIGGVLLAFGPRWMRRLVIRGSEATGGYLMGEVDQAVAKIRLEMLLIIAFFVGAFYLFDLKWQAVLILYACFSFNWSTRQYIAHAFTRRDVIEGAWNLKHNWVMSWLLLHADYDLNHHRRPDVPWVHLPKLPAPGEARRSYMKQYWAQWLGPRPTDEPPPEVPSDPANRPLQQSAV
jgi:fatty acid desaturase